MSHTYMILDFVDSAEKRVELPVLNAFIVVLNTFVRSLGMFFVSELR